VTGRNPAWVAIADDLRTQILAGLGADGSRLPSAAAVAAVHGVSATPAKMAYASLNAEALVRSAPGDGHYVMPCEPGVGRDLIALRWAWEGLYQITAIASGWEAWRTDGSGKVEAATVAGLRDAIREDWPKYAAGVAL
jgi:DNA-binding FadR family transcriptional regulator